MEVVESNKGSSLPSPAVIRIVTVHQKRPGGKKMSFVLVHWRVHYVELYCGVLHYIAVIE